jgi:hypothetical protein
MASFGRYDTDTRRRDYDRDESYGNGSIFDYGDRSQRSSYGGRSDRSSRTRYESRERSYDHDPGRDRSRHGVEADETSRLIASNKVEGTRVYGRDGERIGHIYNFMVGKRSGRVEYAVMAYGGFLGLGERYYPLPWDMLRYDTDAGGYVVDLTERDLEEAPSFSRDNEPRFDDAYGQRVYGWYGLPY